MSISFPDGVDAQGNGAIYWVPAIADTAAPTVSEIAAGIDISCAVEGFGPTGEQGTGTDIRYCSTQQFQTPGRMNVDIPPILSVYDPQMPDSPDYPWYSAMADGAQGYIVNRLGLPYTEPVAAAQVVDVYQVTLGDKTRVPLDPSAEGGKFKVSQKPFVTGPAVLDAVVGAGV